MTTLFERTRPADYLTRLAASDLGRAYKALVLAELDVRAGQAVLDLGCGPGTDLAAFAGAAGHDGAVLGLDQDVSAVRQARRRLAGVANVEIREGDIHRLELPDASVDRVHTDRVLQHVADPAAVLDEARRVLRPGGRAAFAEPDWDTLAIDHPDHRVAVAYRSYVTDRVVRNARIGRQLPRLAESAGFAVVRVVPVTPVLHDARQADQLLGLERVTRRAVAAGYLDRDAADGWLAHLATLTFFACVTMLVLIAEPR